MECIVRHLLVHVNMFNMAIIRTLFMHILFYVQIKLWINLEHIWQFQYKQISQY